MLRSARKFQIHAGILFAVAGTLAAAALWTTSVASAAEVTVNEDGDVVISESARAGFRTKLQEKKSGFRSSRDGQRLLDAVPSDKTGSLKLPVMVLSTRQALEKGGFRSATDERGLNSAVDAVKDLIRDQSGKWYHLNYDGIDPDLDIMQFCSIETKDVPPELLETAERMAKQDTGFRTTSRGDFIESIPANMEESASISARFLDNGVPCTVTIVCVKPDDPRCTTEDFIRDFIAPERRDLLAAPE